MSKTALIMVKDDPTLTELASVITNKRKELNEAKRFIDKRMKGLQDDWEKTNREFWVRVESRLKELGLHKEGENYSMDETSTAIYKGQESSNPLSALLGR
jgi:hypothetical protein